MRILLLSVVFFLMVSSCWAQTETARLQGVVVDSSGGVVPGATITVTNLATNRVAVIQSNEADGGYSVPALPVGRYKIEVTKTGFKAVSREVLLQISQIANIRFTLEPGAVSEVVTVTAAAALVDSASSEVGAIVQGRQVTELPLNGRNFTQLATLIPGVTRGVPDGAPTGAQGNVETFRNGNSGGAALSVNGLRSQANNFILDGLDNNESMVNSIIFFPPAEAIEEFRVQTSIAPAEFGRAGGGLVSASIKSGTNVIHGSLFEFLRNSTLDARPTLAPQRSPFKRNQFGGTLGGPIIKDKLFIFGDYQGLRQSLPLSSEFLTVPTAEFRQGNFSQLLNPALSGLNQPILIRDLKAGQPFAGNLIPASRINPVGMKYLSAYPLPNTNAGKVNGNYVVQRLQVQKFDDFDARTDWNISSKDLIFGRVSFGQDNSTTSSAFSALPAGFGSGQNFNRTRGLAIGETHTFRPNLVQELRVGYARVHFGYLNPFNDRPLAADLGIPNANRTAELGGGASINPGTQLTNTGDSGPNRDAQNTYQAASTTSYIRGLHSFRFGANVIRRQVNIYRNSNAKGQFDFSDPTAPNSTGFTQADMLAGFARIYNIGIVSGMLGTRNWDSGYFAQDDWRVFRNLTLNLGVRYDLYTWPSEAHDRQANFDIASGQILLAGKDGNSHSLVRTDRNNFAPRIGFAYDLRGSGRTVLRGGYGVFYFLDRGGPSNQLAQNPPISGVSAYNYSAGYRIALSGRAPDGSTDSTLATGPLPPGTYAALDLRNPANLNVFAALPNNVNSYVHQWSLQMQRELTHSTVLSAGYVGTGGRKLTSYYDYNRQWFNAPNGTKNLPKMGTVNVQETRGNSSYNSLQAGLERRFWKGLHYRLSYTWAHSIDDSEGAFDRLQPADIRNFALERASSNYDIRHRLVVSSMYEIPYGKGRHFGSGAPAIVQYILGGWQVNGILTLQSGIPFNLSTPGTPSNNRPNVIAPVIIYGNPDGYFSTGSFSRALVSSNILVRPGTLGRNVLVGPGTRVLDGSLFKEFRIMERVRSQLRAEFFNVANTPVFANPSGDISSSDFGRIRGTRLSSERQIQFALRITF